MTPPPVPEPPTTLPEERRPEPAKDATPSPVPEERRPELAKDAASRRAAPAISVRGLTKSFGDFTAVDGIDLDVPRGQIFGFLGPNGSGKTTTIRMLTGTMRPRSGTAQVLGEDVLRHAERVQPRIGYMSQKFALFEDMTVAENLRFYAGVYEVDPADFAARRDYVLRMADLVGHEDELTRNLSVGWRQRLALGAATIHEPELLFLDEPTSGVDPVARRQFWDLLYDLAGRGVTLFVTTHYMDEAAHCHRLAFIYRGRIIADGSPAEIRAQHMTQRVFDVTAADTDAVLQWLEAAPDIDEAYLSGASLHAVVSTGSGLDDASLRRRLAYAGHDVVVAEVDPTIEDVFVNLVARQR